MDGSHIIRIHSLQPVSTGFSARDSLVLKQRRLRTRHRSAPRTPGAWLDQTAERASSTVARTGVADESVPGPAWNAQAFGYVVGGAVIPGHRRCGGPREVVMQHLSEPIVPVESDVDQGLVEARDRATVHLLVRPVATVEAHD